MNQSNNPVVSVCIANYNGEAFIGECIESIINQADAPPFEIIVHDDASTDQSLKIAQQYTGIRTIASERNVGFCVSNNRMAAAARGSTILLLNNDATLMPGALRALMEPLQHNKHIGVVTLTQYDYVTGEVLDSGMAFDPFLNPIPIVDDNQHTLGMVMGACLAVRRCIWDATGGFPEFFGSIAEDMYLCLYARLLGYEIACASSSGYRHRVGGSFGGGKLIQNRLRTSYRRRALSERNKTFNMYLFYPLPALIALLPIHLLLLLIEGTILSTLQISTEPMRRIYAPAIISLPRFVGQLWPLRRRIRASAVISIRQFLAPFHLVSWKLRLLLKHGRPRIEE